MEGGFKNSIEQQFKEEKISRKNLNQLSEDLRILFGDFSESKRYEAWIKNQLESKKLEPLSTDPSAIKSVFYSKDFPDVIIKRFDKGNDQFWYEKEKREFPIVFNQLGNRFLPETKFIELLDSKDSDNKYYVLQDKLKGIHQQQTTDEARELINGSMTEEQIEETYVENPNNWTRLRGEIIIKKLNSEQLKTVQLEAEGLVSCLKELEKNYRVNDLDFFVTEEGYIKIFDFQLHDLEQVIPYDTGGFADGSEEIKMLFNL
jgi:hypothetical protein